MATPIHDKEYEDLKLKAKELIAAGGCFAIQYWSNTDAQRLCPEEYNKLEIHPEVPHYIPSWITSGKKAIELIQQGINLLEPTPPEGKGYSEQDMERLAEAVMCNQKDYVTDKYFVKNFIASLPPQPVKDDWVSVCKTFFIDEIRELIKQVNEREISLSKMVELLNDKK